jgi:hypothetical protein
MTIKRKRPPELISRAFKTDFPEFVERAAALGVKISMSSGRQPQGRVYWLDNYKQLTGFTTKGDGSPFLHSDAVANIDKALTAIEEDRRAIQSMSLDERFFRVISEFRRMKPQYRMIGEVRHPSGDGGYCFFNAAYEGEIRLAAIGTVAKAKVQWEKGVGPADQMAAFCNTLERDYAERAKSEDAR